MEGSKVHQSYIQSSEWSVTYNVPPLICSVQRRTLEYAREVARADYITQSLTKYTTSKLNFFLRFSSKAAFEINFEFRIKLKSLKTR